MPGRDAALTRAVTSSMPTRTFSSRSGALASSSRVFAKKPSLVVVLVRRAELRQRVGADVVVGHDQPVGRDERARAAVVEPDGRRPQVLGPARRRLEPVRALSVPRGRLLKTHIPSSPRAAVKDMMRCKPKVKAIGRKCRFISANP